MTQVLDRLHCTHHIASLTLGVRDPCSHPLKNKTKEAAGTLLGQLWHWMLFSPLKSCYLSQTQENCNWNTKSSEQFNINSFILSLSFDLSYPLEHFNINPFIWVSLLWFLLPIGERFERASSLLYWTWIRISFILRVQVIQTFPTGPFPFYMHVLFYFILYTFLRFYFCCSHCKFITVIGLVSLWFWTCKNQFCDIYKQRWWKCTSKWKELNPAAPG